MSAQPISFVVHGNVQVYNTASEAGPALPYYGQEDFLGEITHRKPEITFNTSRADVNGRRLPDGIEIRFGTARPTEPTRQIMKDHGFQFSEKQTLWYAKDVPKSRALAEKWADEEVEVDTTQYVKHHFWARVRSGREYDQLRDRTEFFVKTEPPKNFYSKSFLERAVIVDDMIGDGLLFFKKFYNKPVDEDEAEGSDEAPPDSATIADRLQALADGMQKAIDEKMNSATSQQRPTRRRNQIVAGMEAEGRVLMRTQKVLYALANAHRSGAISMFPLLENIRTKSQVTMLNLLERSREENWRESWAQETFENRKDDFSRIGMERYADWEAAEAQKQALLKDFTPSAVQNIHQHHEQEIRELERKVWGMNIPGFFPTPAPLIDRMLALAEVEAHHSVLDPSAGKGDILDMILQRISISKSDLYACEINSVLQQILILKGYKVWEHDFLSLVPGKTQFDRILMNPPFERGQDADHVTHALKLLKPGGRLVAIMVEGVFFRKYKKEKAFQELLKQTNAYVSEPIDGAFSNAFNTANVRVRIVAINQDGSPFPFPSAAWGRQQFDDDDDEPEDAEDRNSGDTGNGDGSTEDAALLELEAEAELELLRMRVEQERRKRQTGMDGPGLDPQRLRRLRQKARSMNDWEVLDFK